MKKRDEILKVLLCVLIAVFVIVSAAALLLVGFRSSAIKEQKKQAAMEALKNRPTAVPTAAVSATPTPSPRPTATPTPVPVKTAAFDPNVFWDNWYSTDGTASINVYNISLDTVSFSFSQTDRNSGSCRKCGKIYTL